MLNNSTLFHSRVSNIIIHFYKRLKKTPLLLGYIAIGLAVTFGLHGFYGLIVALKNLFLLLIWALIIRIMTEDSPQPVKIKNAKSELYIGFIFIVYNFIIAILAHNYFKNASYLTKVHVLRRFLQNLFSSYKLSYISLTGLSSSIINAIITIIVLTIPMILIYLLMGYKFKEMGFNRGYWKLTFVLIALSILLGIYEGLYKKTDYKLLVVSYIIQIFINGLHEELLFRGILLPRLEAVLKNSLNALVISAITFSLLHIPAMVIKYNNNILYALLREFSFTPIHGLAGLIFGYLYLRTRSIIPGMLWHASAGILGTMFFVI